LAGLKRLVSLSLLVYCSFGGTALLEEVRGSWVSSAQQASVAWNAAPARESDERSLSSKELPECRNRFQLVGDFRSSRVALRFYMNMGGSPERQEEYRSGCRRGRAAILRFSFPNQFAVYCRTMAYRHDCAVPRYISHLVSVVDYKEIESEPD
jgi:hypothetical protein